MSQPHPGKSGPRKVTAAILLAIGLWLFAFGLYLAILGGSCYFALSGLAVVASGWSFLKGSGRGGLIYGAMLVGTVVWAVVTAGLNPWQLQSRLVAPLVLSLLVYWPELLKHAKIAFPVLALALVGFAAWLFSVNQLDAPSAYGAVASADANPEWRNYGNVPAGTRFSALDQINPSNIDHLKHAWTYHTGDDAGMGFEATPLMVDGRVFLCSSHNRIAALDPDTGKALWTVDPKVDSPPASTCRGVAYYEQKGSTAPCASRVIFGTTDARLMAVDAATGKACADFGVNGTVDLKKGMGPVHKGFYYLTSAPTIARGKIVIGGWVLDGQTVGEPSGVIRSFDAVTGKFAWAMDVDRPHDHGEPAPGKTYSLSTPNSWGPMSADDALGLVYVPTGNSTPDYWGSYRSPGSEKYASSIVAIDSDTGEIRWSFQTVHHDLWDYDVSAQPSLIDLPINGQVVPALVQPTKRGQVFLLDRRNGKLLAPVEERAVPQGASAGDFLAPTQPFNTDMPSFDSTRLTEDSMWGLTPLDALWCRIKFRQARYDGPFTPPGVKPTITYPGYLGGINWGSVSLDPVNKLMVVNWSRMPNYTRLVPREEANAMGIGITKTGGQHVGQPVAQFGTPFAALTGAFLSPLGVPCIEPPFGKITVVNLATRKVVWEKPLGASGDSGPFNLRTHLPLPMGMPNSGGSLTTGAGLIFVAATQERAIRAYEVKTGKRIWESTLPAGGHAAPMTYRSPKTGKQYVVIAAGGNASLNSGSGDSVVAYALQ